MAYRSFVDPEGVRWRVWDVLPTLVDRRIAIRRIRAYRLRHPERRRLPTRRVNMTRSWLYFPPDECGWLCFESPREKLRLRPIPAGWLQENDEGLERLRRSAAPEGVEV